ncbi:MAG TPA: efflux RND transporter periplasmic adaptor subunit [Thermoanaerobaculia bacterium]|nr:efflux RND transporter periplasmic adaptor subunit [Thermoanaerobaculia bacterium]
MRRWRWLVGIGLLVAAALLVSGLRARRDQGIPVDLAPVTRRPVFQSFVTASGEIVASRYADIGSSVMGRLVELAVTEGKAVARGQVLARIDPVQAASETDAMTALLRALEADLAVARARETDARLAAERARALVAQGIQSQAEVDAAVAAADAGAAAVEAADRRVAQGRAQLARARDALAKTEITAPMDGVVTRLSVREGEMVVIGVQNQPGTILMTLSDLSALDAEVKVAEADVLRLALGQSAWVALEAVPGRECTGRVVEVGASALPLAGAAAAAREFRVVVRLDTPEEALRPGLTCDVRILAEEVRDVVTVPLQAVVLQRSEEGEERPGVFLAEAGRVRFAPVETGVIGGLDVEVRGLTAGAEVVAGPFQALRDLADGAAIRPRSGGS